jgi:predicted RNase H-related nuclease YkuK (DUF458 family)
MEQTTEHVINYIKATSRQTKIYVGCDSRQSGKNTTFVTVVVVHHDGNKGAKVFPFIETVPRIKSLKWRLIQETHYATYKALEIKEAVGDREFYVHLDYHPSDKHKSNTVVKEAIGFVVGQGLEYELKPYAHAASSAADYLGRHGGVFRHTLNA